MDGWTETRKLTVGEHRFILGSLAVADHLRDDIESAVRNGGAFIDVELLGGRRIAVLVTPHSTAFFEPFEIPPEEPPGLLYDDLSGGLDLDFS